MIFFDWTAMIRAASERDHGAICAIRIASIRALACNVYSEAQIESWLNGSTGPTAEDAANETMLVEEIEGRVVGFAQLDVQKAVVERVYVLPSYARRRIASRLLARLEAIAGDNEVAMLSIDATLNAVPFYQTAGYSIVQRVDDLPVDGVAFPYVVMTKHLHDEKT